jgi:hypothetical protein
MTTPTALRRPDLRPADLYPPRIPATPTAAWRTLFEVREGRHRGIVSVGPLRLDPAVREGLTASLPVFCIGEEGEGTHLLRRAAATGDRDYVEACRLFIREEQEHARLLGLVLDELGVPRCAAHWSDGVFQTLRRLGGLRTEVLLLLVAELVAVRYYAALAEGVGDPTLRRLFRHIHADEERHLEFHAATLPRHLATLPCAVQVAARWAWTVLVLGSIAVVAVGHRRVLSACGVPPWRFAVETAGLVRRHGPRFFGSRRGAGGARCRCDERRLRQRSTA